MPVRHDLLGGKIQVYRRENSPHWQCSASVGGRQFRVSTRQDGLGQAKDFAEDWYLTLQGKHRFGGGIEPRRRRGKTFRDAGELFVKEYEALTIGERNPKYVAQKEQKLRVHLYPFLGDIEVASITAGTVQDYRLHRMTSRKDAKTGESVRPARSTLHQEIVVLRQVLKAANRQGWIAHVPDLSAPYKTSGKITHRAWFSPEEYKALYQATRRRAQHPPNVKWRWECEQLHDYVLFMANTGLRPDEAARLEFRDVTIVRDEATDERILEIEVRGKRGVGYCKSMPGAVRPFERLRTRPRLAAADADNPKRKGISGGSKRDTQKPGSTDPLFGMPQRELLNAVLDELSLKFDRDGQRRTAYSLRHTYICMRLMEGADIYQIAKNCRTSVEMIENFYAAHIKNRLDASAINVRKSPRKVKEKLGTLSREVE